MADPYLGEIRIMAFNYAPRGWAYCNGQTLPIAQNPALFSLLGVTYGGDGNTTFMLPNLQGCTPIHFGTDQFGNKYPLGQKGGEAGHVLATTEIPSHTHTLNASLSTANAPVPGGYVLASGVGDIYAPPNNLVAPKAGSISTTGGQPHVNMQPSLTLSFCIALQGLYPPRP